MSAAMTTALTHLKPGTKIEICGFDLVPRQTPAEKHSEAIAACGGHPHGPVADYRRAR